jgi:hypothetical protein
VGILRASVDKNDFGIGISPNQSAYSTPVLVYGDRFAANRRRTLPLDSVLLGIFSE